jgi:hypothetical protein
MDHENYGSANITSKRLYLLGAILANTHNIGFCGSYKVDSRGIRHWLARGMQLNVRVGKITSPMETNFTFEKLSHNINKPAGAK